MITIQKEGFDEVIHEIKPLLEHHWNEIALYKQKFPLEPDYSRYQQLYEQGKLVIVTARDQVFLDDLIGYSIFILHRHIHYNSCMVAVNDVIFLLDSYRSSSTAGARLIRSSEKIVQEMGANRITWHIKPHNDWSAILRRMGYIEEEKVMGKVL